MRVSWLFFGLLFPAIVHTEQLAALGNDGLGYHGVAAQAPAFVTRQRCQLVGDLGGLVQWTG